MTSPTAADSSTPVAPIALPQRLFHFTCADHGYAAVGKRGKLKPHWHPLLGLDLLWLTTEGAPDREMSGLGRNIQPCDRMAYRYVVTDVASCRRWLGSSWRERDAPMSVVRDLEAYGDPEHWWCAGWPVVARLG